MLDYFISVFDELMDGKGGVVWLNDGIGDLGGWHDGEGKHHTVGAPLTGLGDQEGSHTSASTTPKRVCQLGALKAIARLGPLTNNAKH